MSAESLWEKIGECLCNDQAVQHWCESCQHKLDLIRSALIDAEARGRAQAEAALQQAREALQQEATWRRGFEHRLHVFRPDPNGECFECGYPQFHDYHVLKAVR